MLVAGGGVGGRGRRATSLRRERGRRSGIFLVLVRGGAGRGGAGRRGAGPEEEWARIRLRGWEGSVGCCWRERVVEEVGERRPLGEGGSAEGVAAVVVVVMGAVLVGADGALVDGGSGGGSSAGSFWRFEGGGWG